MKKPFSKLNLRPWLVWGYHEAGILSRIVHSSEMVLAPSRSSARYIVAKRVAGNWCSPVAAILRANIFRVSTHTPYLDDKMKSILQATTRGFLGGQVNNRYCCSENFSVNFMVSEGLMFATGTSSRLGTLGPDVTNYRCTIFGMRMAGLSRREIKARVTMYGDS